MIFKKNVERALELDHVLSDGMTVREALEGPGVPHTDDDIFPPISPGESLADMLAYKNLSVEKCAKRCKLSVETIEDVLAAYIPVDEEIAKGLARGFKVSAETWLEDERMYQESLLHYGQSRPTPADASPATTDQVAQPEATQLTKDDSRAKDTPLAKV